MAKDKDPYELAKKHLESFLKPASAVEIPVFIPTGHFALDLAISHGIDPESEVDLESIGKKSGGFPLGKLVEISGQEGSGKSSLAYRVVGYAQRLGYKCGWIDSEQSFSPSLADINGVDRATLDYSDLKDLENPNHLYSAEEVFDRICDMCVTGYKVVVLDSVANLTTQAELDNYLAEGGVGMGALAQVLSKGLKRIINHAAKYNVLVIMINQIREKIGILFGSPETTPGGRALKFLSSLRIKLQRQLGEKGSIELETETSTGIKKEQIGGYAYVYILKNRFGKPVNNSVRVPIYYVPYFPGIEEIIFNEGRRLKVIGKHLTSFRWNGIKCEGKQSFLEEIRSKNLIMDLIKEIKAAAVEAKEVLAPEVLYYNADEAKFLSEESKIETMEEESVETGNDTKVFRRRKRKDSTVGTADPVE